MNSRFRFGTTLGAALAVATAAPTASADDSAAAQALFDQAKKALAAHDYSEACPKLEESYKLQEALGTLLNLADCYERAGKLASAWSKFLEVATKARANGQAQRARIGRDRAAALAPKLSNLVVEVPPTSRVQALEIRRDGTVVGEAEWGAVIPADAGAHVIEASAPGRKPWSQTVAVSTGATTARTSVPELTLLPPPPETKHAPEVAVSDAPKTAATADSGSSPGGGQRVAGIVVTGVGVVGVGVGAAFGLLSMAKHSTVAKDCPGTLCTTTEGYNASNDALTFGNVSTVAFIVGGVGLGVGLTLWLTAPKPTEAGSPVAQVVVGPGRVALAGSF